MTALSATTCPPLGLLLDVDGPIASPVTREVRPEIIADLVTLASRGIPVIFNTGRSDAFIREQVMQPMLAAKLPDDVKLHAICEKGAVWFSFGAGGAGPVHVDHELAVPSAFADAVRELVTRKYSEHMFFDETKRAMVSVEQHLDVSNADYLEEQKRFDSDALKLMAEHDLGVSRLDHHAPDSDDEIDYRVDPTIISTDIESIRLGKDLGACRALELLAADGIVPKSWRTVGDSRSDYTMADWLHHNDHKVAHVDVRPADGVPEKPYPILTAGSLIHDDAGAAFLRRWIQILDGEATDDRDLG